MTDLVSKAIYDTKSPTASGKTATGFWFDKIILTSGKVSVMYANHRAMSGIPEVYEAILGEMTKEARELDTDFVVSSAEAGIFWGGCVARELGVGFAYWSKKGKIAGFIPEGVSVTCVDDLNTTLGTLVDVAEGVIAYGAPVKAYIVDIDREEPIPANEERFKKLDIPLISIRTGKQLIDYGLEHGLVSDENIAMVEQYREDPDACAIEIIQENQDWFRNSDRLPKIRNFYGNNDRVRPVIEDLLGEDFFASTKGVE